MRNAPQDHHVLILEDNAPDIDLITFCFKQCAIPLTLHFVKDGVEGSDFLHRQGRFGAKTPRPSLILMDLNMPRKDGRTLVREIRAHSELASIPIVILSTSSSDDEVTDCYRIGVNAFISKPLNLQAFQDTIAKMVAFYFSCIRLPHP